MAGIYDEDTFFTNYANMERSQGLEHAGEWKQLQALFPDVSNQRVLDLGCGMGWHARYFVDHGARFVLALDLSENMLAKARALHRSPKIEYRQADLSSFSIEGSFDFVFANLCLHYLDDLSTLFRQVYATLEKGGVFIQYRASGIYRRRSAVDWRRHQPSGMESGCVFSGGGAENPLFGLRSRKIPSHADDAAERASPNRLYAGGGGGGRSFVKAS